MSGEVFVVMYYMNRDDAWPDSLWSTRALAEAYIAAQEQPEKFTVCDCGPIDSEP